MCYGLQKQETDLICGLLALPLSCCVLIHSCCELFKSFLGCLVVQWLIFSLSKDGWEKSWQDPAQNQIGVCDCWISILPESKANV